MVLRKSAWVSAMIGAISVASLAGLARGQATAGNSGLAVCDVLNVMNNSQEGKDSQSKWRQEAETLQGQVTVKRGQLQTEQDQIKLLVPTSDEYEKQEAKFTEDQMNTQAWLQSAELNFARKQREEQKALYDKIIKTIGTYAQQQKLQIVINSSHAEFPTDMEKMEPAAFAQTILMHPTLYTDPGLDITPQVIIAMDKAYSTSH